MEPYIPVKLPLPMNTWNWLNMVQYVSDASAALAYYNGILESMINPSIFLSPLETKEAVYSSRIEGTVTTVDEVLKFEVDLKPENPGKQNDIIEVLNYRKATRHAKKWLDRGMPFNLTMVCAIQEELMQGVRGEDKRPGELRKEQVWIGARFSTIDQATFVPPEPLGIEANLSDLFIYLDREDQEVLIQTAIMHAQFELIHPFLDGNGRTGRILIPLFLWKKQRLQAPMFYLSEHFNEHREDYIGRLSGISNNNAWEEWICFFLEAVKIQAKRNAAKATQVLALYDEMKDRISSITKSPSVIRVLDALFMKPIFRSTDFMELSGLKQQASFRILTRLKEKKILNTLRKSAGSSPEIFLFDDLHQLLR